jgi:hypothetical protein
VDSHGLGGFSRLELVAVQYALQLTDAHVFSEDHLLLVRWELVELALCAVEADLEDVLHDGSPLSV